ncbi:MAG: TPM domain-containing protein [Leptospira sp.]|nr:TPM domain-containing protein [Leptospira sp.]
MDERIKNVENPRLSGAWVYDGVGYLTDSGALPEINHMISTLETETGAEIAVVTLPSIGSETPKEFAVRLFEVWGIGKQGKDNGVLLLHIIDQRRVEIETGYGNEGILPDILCKRILDEQIIPNFKLNKFSLGITMGVYLLANAIRYPDKNLNDKLNISEAKFDFNDLPMDTYSQKSNISFQNLDDEHQFAPGILKRHFLNPMGSFKEFFYFWLGIILMSMTLIIGLIFSFLPFGNHSLYRLYAMFGQSISWISGIGASAFMSIIEFSEGETTYSLINLLPIGLLLYSGNKWIKNKLRNNTRICPDCKSKMKKLNEMEDDKHLSAGERTEEKIQSVDYDIWFCNSCDKILKEKYSGNSPASKCKKCGFETFRNVSVKVIRSANYEHGGEEIHHDECAHCHHSETRKVTTPKLTKPSNSSNSYGGSSSGSGSWTSGGSSGSWGGGRSGGGGAGSSY